MVQILVRTSSFILMPTLSGTQEHFWAVTSLFQLQWRTGSQSWRGLDVVSHLMRWRYFILTHPAKCEITPTENIFTFFGGYTWAIYRHSYYGPKFGSDLVIRFILMPCEKAPQKHAWACTTLFQLHWRTCSKSWPGLDGWSRNNDTSHLMR